MGIAAHSYITGLLSGLSFLCFLAYFYYRDPAIFHVGLYTSTALLAEISLLPQLAQTLPTGAGERLATTLIWAFALFFYQSAVQSVLNLKHYSPRFFFYYSVCQRSLLVAVSACAAGEFFADKTAAPPFAAGVTAAALLLGHVNAFYAARLCARSGHKGTRYIVLTSVSFTGIWIGLRLYTWLRDTPTTFVDFSFTQIHNQAALIAETLLLGGAILFRVKRQYAANQKVMADLILAESAGLDYHRRLMELRENFETALASNIKKPAQKLLAKLEQAENQAGLKDRTGTWGVLRRLAENILDNARILSKQEFAASAPPASLPTGAAAHFAADEELHQVATGRVVLFAATELLSLSYKNILSGAGFEVVQARGAAETLSLVTTPADIHLLLIACAADADVQTALDLCLAVRQKRPRTQLPVIVVMPQLYDTQQVTDFFAAGASDVFTKFISEPEIVSRIKVNVEYALMAIELKTWHADLEERIRRDTELLRLQGRMNPHFLFNSLNTIYSLLHTDKSAAQKALLLLSDIYRFYLEFSYESLIPLSLEWEFTRNFLKLSQIRYGKFLKISMPESFDDKGKFQIPPLSLQPLVENGIKHGLTEHERDARLSVAGQIRGDGVEISIEDNGVGIHTIDHSRSLGNIKKRILFHYHHADLQLHNRPGGGTVCTLKFSGRKA